LVAEVTDDVGSSVSVLVVLFADLLDVEVDDAEPPPPELPLPLPPPLEELSVLLLDC